ncbi:MAG: VOC family protein [Maricaulaceae bacterium]
MEFLHSMLRISDVDASLKFFCEGLGLKLIRRVDIEEGRFTLIFLASEADIARSGLKGDEYPLPSGLPMVELTHNWDEADYEGGRNFGHLAYRVENIYETCAHLMEMGVTINRPPRDGNMAFVRSPDNISVELLQKGDALAPADPWQDMPNSGTW